MAEPRVSYHVSTESFTQYASPMLSNIVTFALFIAGFPLLIFGADSLVKGASRLAVAWGISALAVGLTVVAYGTSMPELVVTVLAVWKDDNADADAAVESPSDAPAGSRDSDADNSGAADIAVGNVVGSNIANILLVIGAAAVVAPLIVSREIVRRSLPVMVAVSLLVLVFAWDWSGEGRSVITWWQGAILLAGVVLYTWRALVRGRAHKKLEQEESEEIEDEFGHLGESRWAWAIEVARILLGLICLVAGGQFLVNGAVEVAGWLGVTKLMISLTIVALGTSLPEIATCVVAVMRGQRDLAVGNAVGSNIFNILLVLGACAVASPQGGIVINPMALTYDIPIMIGVALLTLPVFYTTYKVARWEGWVFLGLYVAYTVYLILRATSNQSTFAWVMLCVVGMIFAVVLAQSAMQLISHRRARTRLDAKID